MRTQWFCLSLAEARHLLIAFSFFFHHGSMASKVWEHQRRSVPFRGPVVSFGKPPHSFRSLSSALGCDAVSWAALLCLFFSCAVPQTPDRERHPGFGSLSAPGRNGIGDALPPQRRACMRCFLAYKGAFALGQPTPICNGPRAPYDTSSAAGVGLALATVTTGPAPATHRP